MQSGLDREMEKLFIELQKAHNCIILLTDDMVDVLFVATGETKQFTVRTTNKCATMIDIRKAFRTF